ncbi:conjugal transfer protein TraC [Pokkaliibacter plantistimulans]|uniref:Conjugal transfer protein TraC n=1 Tax=Proteobacteria bacterium 228 TaxID=2083153 RepID=A0A2S5KT48_9PROT|nr:VapE domain-containing protein [Pokkaliibacter plantistimulans]PPC77920.1 conjugal transfer protein TraC [Pokkaliibacter plantistimulans]
MSFEALDEVMSQLRQYGLQPSTPLELGKLSRCPMEGDKGKKATGWYVVHQYHTASGRVMYFGAYGDWRTQEPHKIKTKGVPLTAEEREVLKARQAEAMQKARERKVHAARVASKRARQLWERMSDKGASPYLLHKQVVPVGVRFTPNGSVLVPMRDRKANIVGLQVIYPAPHPESGLTKQYVPKGMDKAGAFHMLGRHPDPGEPILVAEGYATAASIHMATQFTVAVAFDAGNLLSVGKAMRELFPGRPLIFCADDDWKTKRPSGEAWNPGVEKADDAALVLGGQWLKPTFGPDRQDSWTDFNDLHLAEGLERVRDQIMEVVRPEAVGGWKDKLQYTQSGALVSHMSNVVLILSNDVRWQGVIRRDDFSTKVYKAKTPPYGGSTGEWSDTDDTMTLNWLSQTYNFNTKIGAVVEAVTVVAAQSSSHPVKEYLLSLQWDGTPRLSFWLNQCLGVAPGKYSELVAERWMVGAVARVMKPGCKMDNVLILEGGQGAGKSTALSILGGEWFMDTPFTLGDKEAFQTIRGKWIIELGELDAFNKADSTKAKQFFGARVDTFRESYGRRAIDLPRQCVFAGTTNQEEYLKDSTGNRRYWPVTVTTIHLDAIREIRDQLWAEAMQCYRDGAIWWVEPEERTLFEEQQDSRYAVDAWEHQILNWLEHYIGEFVTSDVILSDALQLDFGHWGKPEQMRIGHIMHRLGWRRSRLTKPTRSGARPWGYKRPDNWIKYEEQATTAAASPAVEELEPAL